MSKLKENWNTLICLSIIAALFEAGCGLMHFVEGDNRPVPQHAEKQKGIAFQNMSPTEEQELKEFFIDYAMHSPSARKVLEGLKEHGTVIEYFDKNMNDQHVVDAGLSDRETLGLNRLVFKENGLSFPDFFDESVHDAHAPEADMSGISFPDTVFHESEHVLHLNAAYEHGINALSFKSLDAIYTYCTLMEALAYRKATLVCAEYSNGPEAFAKARQQADDVFDRRMRAADKPMEERWAYEQSALAHLMLETNALPNQVYFPAKPDWNKIASVLSRGEVNKVSHLPEPSLMFINACILKELEKHPDAISVDEFDMSCAISNRSTLRQDELAVKKMISNVLMETHDACVKTGRSFPRETQYNFLYLMGWPTAEQMKTIESKERTFSEVQEENLNEFTTDQLFDAAEGLIASPEVQSYNIDETKNYGRMLHFSRQILRPQKGQRVYQSQKTR